MRRRRGEREAGEQLFLLWWMGREEGANQRGIPSTVKLYPRTCSSPSVVEHRKDTALQLEQTTAMAANWLRLCGTPGSEHRHLTANMGLHLSRPPARHSGQEKYAQHASDMPAGRIGGAVPGETGAEGRWGGNVALTGGRAFHATGSTAKLVFWSVSERKQDANSAGGTPFRMLGSVAFMCLAICWLYSRQEPAAS